jgi:hypothetical protein
MKPVVLGEIYEGGWYYGTRHGKGICIYSDGLMYEVRVQT